MISFTSICNKCGETKTTGYECIDPKTGKCNLLNDPCKHKGDTDKLKPLKTVKYGEYNVTSVDLSIADAIYDCDISLKGNVMTFTRLGESQTVVVPPTHNGIDIIDFGASKVNGYTFDFKGVAVITSNGKRSVYYRGIKMC